MTESPKRMNLFLSVIILYTIHTKFEDFSSPSLLETSSFQRLIWFCILCVWLMVNCFKINSLDLYFFSLISIIRPHLTGLDYNRFLTSVITYSTPIHLALSLPTYVLFFTSHLYESCSSVKSSSFITCLH